MRAYYTDDGTGLTSDALHAQGIHHEVLPLDPKSHQGRLDEIKAKNGYVEQDIIELSRDTPNLEDICKKFDHEHLHTEDEVRFVLAGEGVFDIRSRADRWMRVVVESGDLIVVPKDRYHRFELTERKAIRCVRLFQDKSGWVPQYREARA